MVLHFFMKHCGGGLKYQISNEKVNFSRFCFLQIASKIGGEDPMHDDNV